MESLAINAIMSNEMFSYSSSYRESTLIEILKKFFVKKKMSSPRLFMFTRVQIIIKTELLCYWEQL